VSPCFPPHYNIFDIIFQMYHVQFAQVRFVTCHHLMGVVSALPACLRWSVRFLSPFSICGLAAPAALDCSLINMPVLNNMLLLLC
jgi:hypothetical protein